MNSEDSKTIVCHKCGYNFGEINGETLVLCPDCKEIKNIDENDMQCQIMVVDL